jgi:hypothetical protein
MPEQPEELSADSGQISLSGYPVISSWCRSLGCSEVQLAEAIAAVGYSASEVRAYLKKGPEVKPVRP